MALTKIQEARSLSDEELLNAIAETKRELFQLRFQKATRQLDKQVHQFKHLRHRLAQLMTVQRERQLIALEAEAEAQDTAVAAAATESVSA
ncbi:50S ribosomal protein L29 [Phormidium tenue]|uniref:Large ribosomal subunit protein uL29 n=1 Tax=Phormidium tenue NIES-30 TaxID=549789 RepID=A0A1U7J2P2_9CYAN|nr:50S ribosomal protein L29 [Phormidium tenue]MBD2231839.1 50S ribosomal protein L29 [Phormidium tenue FACHB-1052]OKH46399.1 50S ribosomal protein L29 [Phormidium tenue NIES-30]